MTDAIINTFYKYINTLNIYMGAAIAVSGGSDSLALMFLIDQWKKEALAIDAKNSNRIVTLTVNHNLRENALIEAEYVHQLAKQCGIEHHILTWQPPSNLISNIAHVARKARLQLLTEWCKTNKIFNLMIGHTKDDIVETFFMNALRGSGVYGLSSIPIDTIYNGIRVIRPVSNFSKKELTQYLIKKEIKWIEDPSNQDSKFLRVRVRKMLPEFQSIMQGTKPFADSIMTNVNNLSRTRKFIEESSTSVMVKAVQIFSSGNAIVDRKALQHSSAEIALYILTAVLITISGKHEYKPRLESLHKLYSHICQNSGNMTTKRTLWNCEIACTTDIIHIYKERGKQYPKLERLSCGNLLWDGRFIISTNSGVHIKEISYVSDSQLNELMTGTSFFSHTEGAHSFSKKIYRSLPLIKFSLSGRNDDNFYLPFVMPKHKLINVHFHPTIPLSKV